MPGNGRQLNNASSLQGLGGKDALSTGMREEIDQESLARETAEMNSVLLSRRQTAGHREKETRVTWACDHLAGSTEYSCVPFCLLSFSAQLSHGFLANLGKSFLVNAVYSPRLLF